MILVRLTYARALPKDRGFNTPENLLYLNPYHYSMGRETTVSNSHSKEDEMTATIVTLNNGKDILVEESLNEVVALIHLATRRTLPQHIRCVDKTSIKHYYHEAETMEARQ